MKIFNPQSNINYRELRIIFFFKVCSDHGDANFKNACTNCTSGGAEKIFKLQMKNTEIQKKWFNEISAK